MSRHEGVSCDSCLIGNFRGKRYKCLICYDYDLCATCYEGGSTTTRHTAEHPMQCILARSDFDLYYGGEAVSLEQPQSFTCPFCGKMGFTEPSLQEHVGAEHPDTNSEVVCPVCAALPGGEPNHVTEDFATHLTLEHRTPRDLEEPPGSRHSRRIPHPGRGVGGTRPRRANMHFSTSGGLASLSPNSRESVDPIAELLSQLSGVRRNAAPSQQTSASQLQQLQMQLHLERQQFQAARQQLERLPRRQGQASSGTATTAAASSAVPSTTQPTSGLEANNGSTQASGSSASQFLLARCTEPDLSENELQALDMELASSHMFVQEFLSSALTDTLIMDDPLEVVPFPGQPSLSGGKAEGEPVNLLPALLPAVEAKGSVPSKDPPADVVVIHARPASPNGTAGNLQAQASGQGQVTARTTTANVTVAPKKPAPTGGGGGGGGGGPPGTGAPKAHSTARPAVRQQPSSTISATNSTISVSNVTAQVPRMAPQGTGTIREVPSQSQVVGGGSGRVAPIRAAASPAASSRRKMPRHVDGRNQFNEPPPPH